MEAGRIEIDGEAHLVHSREALREGQPLPLYGLRVGQLVAVETGPDGTTFTYTAEPGRPPRFRVVAELRDQIPLVALRVS
jgi:hypothetical protein